MSTVRVCLLFVYAYRLCMSTVRLCLLFVYAYRSSMSTIRVCLPLAVKGPQSLFCHVPVVLI